MSPSIDTGEYIPGSERYQVRGTLGRGAMGRVYRAFDRETETEIALKTLHTHDPEDLYRLKREFRALADITHPNLVQLHELEVSEEHSFLTMELVEGVDFLSHVRPDGRLDEGRLRRAFQQLASGLRAIHDAGQLHRDIKPSNVLVEASGRLVILDFGLVAETGGELSRASRQGAMVGTFAYMSPEQAVGAAVGPASDWYSAGVMLYEALTGRLPFDQSGVSSLFERREAPPPRPSERTRGVPPDLDALTVALLQPDPERRPSEETSNMLLDTGAASPGRAIRGRHSGRSSFVGRGRELAELEAAYAETRDGKPVQVLLQGPSGIGKSALAAHFVARLESRDHALVLRSKCLAQESVRFGAADGFIDELSRFLVFQSSEQLAAVAPRYLDALVRVFPVLGRVPFRTTAGSPDLSSAEPREVRRRAFRALRELVTRLADRQPLVITIDDYQWSDADSARLIDELLAPPDPPVLLVLLVQRSDSPPPGGGPGTSGGGEEMGEASKGSAGGLRRLTLGPLADEEVSYMLAEILDEETMTHATAIARESAGSPFFVHELARSLGGESAHTRPPRVSDVVRMRLEHLEARARAILETVAVAGAPIERSVAFEAAGLREDARPIADRLLRSQMLRLTTVGDEPAIETYHDRIREAVLGALPEATRVAHHAALADALARSGRASSDTLLRHEYGAGRIEAAAERAADAGADAAASFAFAQAAEFYRMALEWRAWPEAKRRRLLTDRAEALVNAGRGNEAAALYLEASETADQDERRALHRMAAEQLLVSGNIDDGIRVLRPLLRELGVRYPASPRSAMIATLLHLVVLRIRGTRFREREETAISPKTLARIDACYAGSRGLVAVDTIRGGYLSFVGLRHALRAGEPVRVGSNLAISGGGVLAPMGGAVGRWGRALVEQARALAERTGDIYLEAAAALSEGQMAIFSGDWNAAVERSETAISLLRQHCRGVTWECSVGHTALLRGLEELGSISECLRLARRHRDVSREVGDRYGSMVASLHLGSSGVAAGDTEAACQQIREQMESWPSEGFLVQHLYALRIEILADLSRGDADLAWQRIVEAWPTIASAQFLRVPVTRIDSHLLRSRAALALSATRADPSLLRQCDLDARRLAGEGRPDTRAHAALLVAGMRARAGDAEGAHRNLQRAHRGYVTAKMALDCACVDYCIGELRGGDEGSDLRSDAEQRILQAGVGNPRRWVRVVAPGLIQ